MGERVIPAFDGWMPVRITWESGSPHIEWILLGDRRFTDSFFEDTIQDALRHPFHQAFRRTTEMEALQPLFLECPGLAPQGFVFHMSRCGSTLVCRALAVLESNIVLSEPPVLDSILRAHLRTPALTEGSRAAHLRWMLSALGRRRHTDEERTIVKFDCWSISELAVVRKALPEVPWIFLYRDPIEVLVSQLHQRALWNVPGALAPQVFRLESADLEGIPQDEYCARLLGRICELALQCFQTNQGGLLVNYSELPEFLFSEMLEHFRLNPSKEDLARMREVALRNSKTGFEFEPDRETKQRAATGRMRELADRWIMPAYRQLEAERLGTALPAHVGYPETL